jgi:hypothetical protein
LMDVLTDADIQSRNPEAPEAKESGHTLAA